MRVSVVLTLILTWLLVSCNHDTEEMSASDFLVSIVRVTKGNCVAFDINECTITLIPTKKTGVFTVVVAEKRDPAIVNSNQGITASDYESILTFQWDLNKDTVIQIK